MYFDWRTWGIWLTGFIIMIVWIIVPVREFKKVLEKKRNEMKQKNQNNKSRTIE